MRDYTFSAIPSNFLFTWVGIYPNMRLLLLVCFDLSNGCGIMIRSLLSSRDMVQHEIQIFSCTPRYSLGDFRCDDFFACEKKSAIASS
jgi:hypothetical protein